MIGKHTSMLSDDPELYLLRIMAGNNWGGNFSNFCK